MLTTYGKLKDQSKAETQKYSKELSKLSGSKVSFTIASNLTTNSMNLAIANEEGVLEVEFKMDRFSIHIRLCSIRELAISSMLI